MLGIIRQRYKDDPKKLALVKSLYNRYPNSFYVHAKNRMKNAKSAARYIGRYLARPAIAECRIISYNGQKVKFWYVEHKAEQRVEAKLDALAFIGKLTMHIPKKHFRMVRRYGLYRRGRNDIAIKAVDAYNPKHGIMPRQRSKKTRRT